MEIRRKEERRGGKLERKARRSRGRKGGRNKGKDQMRIKKSHERGKWKEIKVENIEE